VVQLVEVDECNTQEDADFDHSQERTSSLSSAKVELGAITNHSAVGLMWMQGAILRMPFGICLTWWPSFPERDGPNLAEKYEVAIFHIQLVSNPAPQGCAAEAA